MKTVTARLKGSGTRVLIVLQHITNVTDNSPDGAIDIWDTGGKCVTVATDSLSCGSVDVLFEAIEKVHTSHLGKPDTPFWIRKAP